MTTTELVSVGRAALSDMLEQWWVRVDVDTDAERACRARLRLEWSPWDRKYTIDPEAVEYLDSDGSGRLPSRAEIVESFRGSDAERRAHEIIREEAAEHRRKFPERADGIAHTR